MRCAAVSLTAARVGAQVIAKSNIRKGRNMELLLTGKHIDIAPEDRELAETLSAKLAADYEKLSTLRLVLSQERNWQIAEALLNGKHVNFMATAKTDKFAASIAAVMDKLDKQMRRYLEKVQDLSVKANPEAKEKIWTSEDLKKGTEEDNYLFT